YLIGNGFQLLQSLSTNSFCDTINVCADSVKYRVELLNNGTVCSSSNSNINAIHFQNAQAIADFNHSTSCGVTVQFTNNSSISAGIIDTYLWDYVDGSPIDTTTNPIHTYPSPGTYNVKLIVLSNKNCPDTVRKFVTLNMPFVDAG